MLDMVLLKGAHCLSPRLAASHFYKGWSKHKPGHVQPAGDLPLLWVWWAVKGGLSGRMAALMRNATDLGVTGGRWSTIQH